MKAKDIEIGGVYLAKVSGQIVPLRVVSKRESYHHRGGHCGASRDRWVCKNEKTGREVVVKSPQRFRSRAEPKPMATEQQIVTCRCGKRFVPYDPPGKPPRTLCGQCLQQSKADANYQRMAFAKDLPVV